MNTVGNHQGSNQQQKRPRSHHGGFHQLPLEDVVGREWERLQKTRFLISKHVGVANHHIGKQQQHEEHGKKQEHQMLNQQVAEPGKFGDITQARPKQAGGNKGIEDQKHRYHERQRA